LPYACETLYSLQFPKPPAHMRPLNLSAADPLALRLAADVRLGPTDYANDHIWEVVLAGGEPAALAVRTTYGLRAQNMRLYPSFVEGERTVTDPADYAEPPLVQASFVNYVRVACAPWPGLAVSAEYWVPDSHTLVGQLTLTNTTAEARTLTVLLTGQLKPLENPRPRQLTAAQLIIFNEAGLLEGQTGNLDVVVLLEGPASPQAVTPAPPLPEDAPLEVAAMTTVTPATLARPLALAAGETVVLRWVQTAEVTPTTPPSAPVRGATPPIDHREPGLGRIRELLAREWEGEFAKLELLNAGLLDIETGDREWDAALALAQSVALRCYVGGGPGTQLPHPSFVFTRHPDRGYSVKGDGSDYNWQWNGQVATEAYVNLPQIAASAPELAKGVLRNWLAVQAEDGFVDWKPGLAGQRERTLCIPLLATMAWQLYEHTEDAALAAELYPGLRRFLDAWFAPRHDRDQDGLPEWTHTLQSAFDENPSFVRWVPWGQGADISAAETPDLAAYLYRECRSLQRLAARIGAPADPLLEARADTLARRVAGMWNEADAIYHYVDRDSHQARAGEVLATGRGDLTVEVLRRFPTPARLLIKAVGPREARPNLEVVLSGRGRRGRPRVETLRRTHVQHFFGIATAVSEKLYTTLERVEVRGLSVSADFEVTVSVVDYTRQDQTLLLPLWAGLPDALRAEALVRRTLLDPARFWRPYGLPNCSAADPAYAPDNRNGSGGVWMMWNTMLGEGLVDYGYRAEAAELVTRLMQPILHCLKTEKAFREAYHSEQLGGLGDKDYLWGVAPVALFMRVLGVRLVGPHKVYLEGHNPFPWPVTIRHKGLTIVRGAETTTVTFPNGRSATVTGAEARMVEDG